MTRPFASPTSAHPDLKELWAVVAAVADPEMPPLTIEDLGILRAVERDSDGTVVVTVTPTYSGCPAVEFIEDEVANAVAATGVVKDDIIVRRALSPAWSTDWITESGLAKLLAAGISPPGRAHPQGETPVRIGAIACPQCGSINTEEISRFGSTACKALHRCLDCSEPFDHVKEL